VRILRGPAGGGCAMTARELSDRAGGFKERPGEVFWLEDAAYIGQIHALGYTSAVLADLRVHHTGGPYYSTPSKEKEEYWRKYWAAKRRRLAVKKALVMIPGVRPLNARFSWFEDPRDAIQFPA
jgi:hypothetical protein